jgi:hypothetical protein
VCAGPELGPLRPRSGCRAALPVVPRGLRQACVRHAAYAAPLALATWQNQAMCAGPHEAMRAACSHHKARLRQACRHNRALTAYSCAERQLAPALPCKPHRDACAARFLRHQLLQHATSCSNTPHLGVSGIACCAQGARSVLGARPLRSTAHLLPAGCLPFALAAAAAVSAASLLPAAGA